MLGGIRSPTRSQLVETTPQLMTAIDRLNDQIAAVEALLSADDAALGRFFQPVTFGTGRASARTV